MMAEPRLDSWKEIAAYLKRGVRTVQRWERENGLPVHRLPHASLSTVFAWPHELDTWWTQWSARTAQAPPAAAAAAEPVQAIAVLPFLDLTPAHDHAWFCDGLAEEILGRLSQVPQLKVVSRAASFRYRGADLDLSRIGRALAVHHVLEGSVRRSGEQCRISTRLVSTSDGVQVWVRSWDRDLAGIFAVQEEIAREVAQSLNVAAPAPAAVVPTPNLTAYDCYLKGRSYYYGYGPQDMDFAIQLFLQATALDPAYAAAWAGLADCWSYLYLYSSRTDLLRQQAVWASRKAVELDPQSAAAHTSLALAISLTGTQDEAEREFDLARSIDPRSFEAAYFYARHAFAQGDLVKARGLYEEARRIHPGDYQSPLLSAQIYDDLGDPAQAQITRLAGIQLAQDHLAFFPDDVRALYMAANGMVALGQIQPGCALAARARALRPNDPMVLYNLGCIYSMAHQTTEALNCLEKAVAQGLRQRGWFEHDNNLDHLRPHPRFQQLLASLPPA